MIQKVTLNLFCLFVISGSIFSQSQSSRTVLDSRILFADSLRNNGDAIKKISRLKNSLVFPDQPDSLRGLDFYNLAICYAADNKLDSSCYCLLEALEKTNRYNNLIYTDTDFEILYNRPCWTSVTQRIDSAYLSDNHEITNKELALELFHIYLSDQHARGLGLKKVYDTMHTTDSINKLRVKSIIQEYGWPTFSMVGTTAATGAFLVIQHSDLSTQMRYSKLILNAAMEGEATKEWAALLLDRIAVQLKGIQFFGTQVYQVLDSTTGLPGPYRYFPIRDESIVDSIRAEMGMIPLKDYLKLFGIDYQPVQK